VKPYAGWDWCLQGLHNGTLHILYLLFVFHSCSLPQVPQRYHPNRSLSVSDQYLLYISIHT
jgi:hypothetical protein